MAVFLVARLLPNIRLRGFGTAVVVALVYSLVNYLVGWLLVLLSLPFLLITFGLFKFVINAFMLWVTDKIVEEFEIRGVGTLLIAAFLITIIDSVLRWIFM